MVDNVEMRNGIENKTQFNNNIFHLQHGNIYLTFYGHDFKFTDVPGDGDCFYHSVLKYSSIQEKFNGVQDLRQYLRDVVAYWYPSDRLLQCLFSYERQDVTLWCSMITRMGVWATTFDTLIFSYIMTLNVIVIGNYLNGFSANNMHHYLLQLRLPDVIPDKPAIHVYFHRFGSPLEIANNCNHFAYLKPTSIPTDERINCDLQNRQRQPIVSQDQESSIASTQGHTSAITNPLILSTPPIGLTEQQCSLPSATMPQDSDVLDKERQCSILSM